VANQERLNELLMEWEDRRDQGRPVTPEDLCRDAPELLDELKKRIKALQSMDGLLNCEAPAITAPRAPTPQTGGDGFSACSRSERPHP